MADKKAPRILVVEDETEIRQLIELHLRRQGFDVRDASDGQTALKMLEAEKFDLIIFDWMLPDLSGIDLTRWVRTRPQTSKIPVIFVTAKVEPDDIVRGLEAGADDYLTKPFENGVLLARVKSQLRRRSWERGETDPDVISIPGLTIYPKKFEVHQDGQPVDLTKSEFILLQSLLNNSGRVLTRKQLAELIIGDTVNVVGRAVDTHIFTLRKKLGLKSEIIETVRGIGYRVRLEERV